MAAASGHAGLAELVAGRAEVAALVVARPMAKDWQKEESLKVVTRHLPELVEPVGLVAEPVRPLKPAESVVKVLQQA